MKGIAQKGVIHILPVVVVGIVLLVAAAFFLFNSSAINFLSDSSGPPPSEPEARNAWLAENLKPMDKTVIVIDEELPTWEELDEMNAALPQRQYPKFIKAIQTYGTTANLVESLYFGDDLADLGVNTQFVHANYWFKKGEFELWYLEYDGPMLLNQDESKRALVHNILSARKQGLAVVLFPDYQELEDNGMNELGITDDLEDRLETISLDLAQIAEKYKVEYFVPVNQIEMILDSNGYDKDEARSRTNAFYASVTPQIKEVYNGKVMYKMGGFGDWNNYDGISLEGADVFGFTGCYNGNRNDVNFIVTDIENSSVQAAKMSKEYGVPWINAEFIVSDAESNINSSFGSAELLPIEDYYEAALPAFDEYAYANGAMGFTIHSLLSDGQVYDTPAWPLIKDFFASK